ncbi:MAG: hypothetical protein ABI867_23295 [Kofleriaceae bacterium]
METFCCMQCRLLQPQATECAACTSIIAPLVVMQRMLGMKDPNNVTGRSRHTSLTVAGTVLGYLGLVAGSLFAPITVPIGLGAAGLVGGIALARSKGRIRTVADPPPELGKTAVTQTGIARKLRETTPSLVDSTAVLAEQVELRRRGGLVFRRVVAVPFLVELPGEKLVVAGVVRIAKPRIEQPGLERKDRRLAELGIPEAFRISARVEVATIRDGDPVAVTGELATEIVSDLAFHRDAGEVAVMRGRARALVVIS